MFLVLFPLPPRVPIFLPSFPTDSGPPPSSESIVEAVGESDCVLIVEVESKNYNPLVNNFTVRNILDEVIIPLCDSPLNSCACKHVIAVLIYN